MKAIYCTETQDRIPVEYFDQGKAVWSGGKPYLTSVAQAMGLKPDKQPPQAFLDMRAGKSKSETGVMVQPPLKVSAPPPQSAGSLKAVTPTSSPAMPHTPQVNARGEDAEAAGGQAAGAAAEMESGSKLGGASTVLPQAAAPLVGSGAAAESPEPIYVKSSRPPSSAALAATTDTEKTPLPGEMKGGGALTMAEVPTVLARPSSAAPETLPPMPTPAPVAAAAAGSAGGSSAGQTPTVPEGPSPVAGGGTKRVESAPAVPEESEALRTLRAELHEKKAAHTALASQQHTLMERAKEAEQACTAAEETAGELKRRLAHDAETVEAAAVAAKASTEKQNALRGEIAKLSEQEAALKKQLEELAEQKKGMEEQLSREAASQAKHDIEAKTKRKQENTLKAELAEKEKASQAERAKFEGAQRELDGLSARVLEALAAVKELEKTIAEKVAAEEHERVHGEVERKRKEEEERVKRRAEELARVEAEMRVKLEALARERVEAEAAAKRITGEKG